MRFLYLLVTCAVLCVKSVSSENGIDIKRGTFPFMAYVFYPDQIEPIFTKFTRSAVLIRENWLITSSLENEDSSIAFPEKTLVARLGAIRIDARFTFNEDEDEQEREIIQIVRPYSHNANSTDWWNSDISLLKTLSPFNITLAVATIELNRKLDYNENCYVLFYANLNQNTSDDRVLMQMEVELLPSSVDHCGNYYRNETMICAKRMEENSINMANDFCQGNSGGPLICKNTLTGIQTYINNCKEPFLYQFLNAWEDLITCAIGEKCHEVQCSKVCININKDPLTEVPPKIIVTEEILLKLVDNYLNETNTEMSASPTITMMEEVKEIETTKTTLYTVIEEEITTKTTILPSVTYSDVVSITHTDIAKEDTSSTTATVSAAVETASSFSSTVTHTTIGASVKVSNKQDETTDYTEERERKAKVEAQQHRLTSRAPFNKLDLFNSIILVLCILTAF